jgi:16S rRNA (guanine(1405)-N(7))-methyltransferase
MRDARVEEVIAQLRTSRKYATLGNETLERVADWALARHASVRSAARAARAKLHQVYGAYLAPRDLAAAERRLGALPASASKDDIAAAAREILERHASSAERLAFMESAYQAIFELAGGAERVESVLDLACGLHPLALPWMGLSPRTQYLACDLDTRLTAVIGTFLERWGQAGRAWTHDLLSRPLPPEARGDVVLLLKTLPCLERQERGASLRLLQSLDARLIVLSFPAHSLGGREKGMREQYDAFARELVAMFDSCCTGRVTCTRLVFAEETFYLLERETQQGRSA